MYLKQLDIIGFKSFADRTRLTFEPGMIAIVGPNGCGKSNVSDSIRWVLGEQRPTALRCSKIVDVVFNGTDMRKPLGLAEVSITFADCEALLGTEYHEVTVTRRVYRSGEGEYFINKTPCRLKDVQRLFMGTGIGTTSYSVLAQGQIDAILSSKPEDRRAVFEEAAGITKFKADRKEALRKIDQTQANLLREADVLREMKRQIGSLQRQVGKAKRYKTLRDELRGLDIYLSKGHIVAFNLALEANALRQRETEKAIADASAAVTAAETGSQAAHAAIHAIEEKLAALATEAAAADSAFTRAHEVISVNEGRIAEYKAWSERDSKEIAETRRQLEEIGLQVESLVQKSTLLEQGLATAKGELAAAETAFAASTKEVDALRAALQQGRSDSILCDRRSAQIRAELSNLEAQAHEAILRHERLASEDAQLRAAVAAADKNLETVRARLASARATEEQAAAASEAAEDARTSLAAELDDLRTNFGKMQAEAAACEAQLKLLNDTKAAADSFAAGAKALLDEANPLGLASGSVLGPLADRFNAPAELRVALEAALRAWLDAVVVKDAAAARAAVSALLAHKAGSARVVAPGTAPAAVAAPGNLPTLLSKITVTPDARSVAEALLGNVFLAETAAAVPPEIPAGAVVVTRDGTVFRSDGAYEVWMPGSAAASPLSRRLLTNETTARLDELRQKISAGEQTLATGAERSAALADAAKSAAQTLEGARRTASEAQGEAASMERDAAAAKARLETVSAELKSVLAANAGDESKRAALAKELEETAAKRDALIESTAKQQADLAAREAANGELSRALTEKRITVGQMESEQGLTKTQSADAAKRADELKKTIEGREAGIRGYEESISRLTDETAELMGSLDDLKEKAATVHARIEDERVGRDKLQADLATADGAVTQKRTALDEAKAFKSKLEVAAAEATMRRQNVYDHLNNEYAIPADAVVREPDPEWKDGKVPPETELSARLEQLNGEIQALGPVNMVAIDEFQELEERYTKEKAQEADLLAAKDRILGLITNLNTKSSDLFKATFAKANENFQLMFKKLFNGGEAKLVLLENVEDPLDAGIDIIARPPGKRPQSVTLLSGGERTMTAVALLFAIFMIKPAPFCMLDELDAALDDSNIGRFVQALKDFLDRSQFLIITHNQHTIAGSDLVYGVSQQEKGVSRIISMRLTDIGVKPLPEDKVPPGEANKPPDGGKMGPGADAPGSGTVQTNP